MEFSMSLVCSECGEHVAWGDNHECDPGSTCRSCGGRIDGVLGHLPRDSSTSRTPASLELTPEAFELRIGAEDSDPDMPDVIDRFRIRSLLGGGGFGRVYRAYDARLERDIALKVLREARPSPRVIERFFREARAAAQLDHPHIVALHDAGRDAGRCWIAYQFVDGATLSRYRERARPDLRDAVEIVRDLADALDHAHRRGVFHRDLKPANILVDASGHARLTDFGLARRVDFDATMTHDGAILGTPAYMSPEAASGNAHQADARSDLYSLGIIFYEMICGHRPADLPSGIPVWRAASKVPPPSPRSCNRSIPRPLERSCLRALAANPDERYPDARSFAADLDRWLDGRESPWRFARVGLLSATLLAAVAAREIVALASSSDRPPVADAAQPGPPQPTPPVTPIGERSQEPERYVGNSASMTVHRDHCAYLVRMSPARRVTFSGIEDATRRNFKPCKTCMGPRAIGDE